jgi:hypothetical protein
MRSLRKYVLYATVEMLKIEGKWQDAVKKSLTKKKPPAGRPK